MMGCTYRKGVLAHKEALLLLLHWADMRTASVREKKEKKI
jgi:hypothetical protein